MQGMGRKPVERSDATLYVLARSVGDNAGGKGCLGRPSRGSMRPGSQSCPLALSRSDQEAQVQPSGFTVRCYNKEMLFHKQPVALGCIDGREEVHARSISRLKVDAWIGVGLEYG